MLKNFFFSLKARRVFYRGVLFLGDAVIVGGSLYWAYHARFHWNLFINVLPITKGIPSYNIYRPIQWSATLV